MSSRRYTWNEFILFEHIEMFLYLDGYSKKKAKKSLKNSLVNVI